MSSQKLRSIFSPVLFPMSLLYGLAVGIRNKLFDLGILRSVKFGFPVICVGNITVGGTGKTPHVEYLLGLLGEKFRVAMLSRGYRRKTKGFVEAGKRTGPGEIGDEPFQIFRKFSNLTIAVDEKRAHGIRTLRERYDKLQAVILDDAFQHRYVESGINIVLVDYYRPIYRDHILPYGFLREPAHAVHRANIVIVTKVPHHIKPIEKRIWIKELDLFPYQFLYFTSFDYGHPVPVFSSGKKGFKTKDLDSFTVLLVSGIGNPAPLIARVKSHAGNMDALTFPDHHEYKKRDIRDIILRFDSMNDKKKIIITTEKDAVKIEQLHDEIPLSLQEKIYYLPVKIKFLDNKQQEFDDIILDYVKKNRRISRLHQ